jgi:hypothetical protein
VTGSSSAANIGSSSLLDLAVDLINDAKSAKDAKQKIYLLEQVKEIVLHRDKSLLTELLSSIMDFMVEKSVALKKFLLQFCNDIINISSDHIPVVLSLYSFIVNENTESLLKIIAGDLRSHYTKIVMYVVSLPPLKQKQLSSHGQANPNVMWQQLKEVVNCLVEINASDKSESLRSTTLKLLEPIILFGLATPVETSAKVADPRLRRAAGGASASTGGASASGEQTAANIPLHHHFINRSDVEQDAEALLTKILLWASRNGPQSAPFTPMLMSVLGQVIAGIASARSQLLGKATIALVQLVQGKSSVCAVMSGIAREHLARSIQRLIRTLTGKQGEEDNVNKLRSTVSALETLGFDESAAVSAGQKRDRESPSIEDIDEQQQKILRADAIAALNAMTTAAAAGAGDSSGPGTATTGSAVAVSGGTSVPGGPSQSADTELATSIADLELYTNATIKLGSVQLQTGTTAKPIIAPAALQADQSDVLSNVAFESLIRLLTSFDESVSAPVVGYNEKVRQRFAMYNLILSFCFAQKLLTLSILIMRSALTLSSLEMTSANSVGMLSVPIVASLPSSLYVGKLLEGIPVEVQVSRLIHICRILLSNVWFNSLVLMQASVDMRELYLDLQEAARR